MTLQKLTTIPIVDSIEACLPTWQSLGYRVVDRVPEQGAAQFVILSGAAGELMLQTRASLKEDLPQLTELAPAYLLYARVESLASASKLVPEARVLVAERTTFYGARERWLELPGGEILCLSQHAAT